MDTARRSTRDSRHPVSNAAALLIENKRGHSEAAKALFDDDPSRSLSAERVSLLCHDIK
jgi:hypothetical protein